MTVKPLRIVLAFYPSGEMPADRAWQSLQRVAKVCLVRPDTRNTLSSCKRYAMLRLEGETLVVAETQPLNVENVVKTLRLTGSPAIFVVRPDSEDEGMVDFAGKGTLPSGTTFLTRRAIIARLQEDDRALDAACTDLTEAARLDHSLSPAAEWILDNSYLVHTQITEVHLHLPRDYSTWSTSGSGHGRVYTLAHELVAKTGLCVTDASIRDCLRDGQSSSALTIAELWAFPLFLRIALIEALTELAVKVSRGQQLRESAYLWANRLAGGARAGNEVFEATLHNLEAEPLARQPHFATALAEQLQGEEMALGPAQRWIENRFGKSLIELVREQHTGEAAATVSTSNAFGSLRTLGRLDFTKIFEAVSLVEAELRADPAGVYGHSDFPTRDQCRRIVEKTALYSGLEEVDVARRAVGFAGESSDPRTGQVAWYLLSDGLTKLESDTKARVPAGVRALRSIWRHATPVYLTAITGLTICFTLLACLLASEIGLHYPGILIALAALALFPLSELSVQIVNALVISLLPPNPLPKMDFRDGIPARDATLAVVPMMLNGADVVRAELEKLEVRFLGNRNENIFFS